MLPALTSAIKNFFSSLGAHPDPVHFDMEAKETAWYQRSVDTEATGSVWSGEAVTASTAQNHSVVWACKRIISESVAFLPLAMMRNQMNGKYPASDHPMYSALHDAPNEDMSAMSFRETLTAHLVMNGNCYARITRRGGTGAAVELEPLDPVAVDLDRDKQGRLVYVVGKDSYTIQRGKPHDILHVKGLSADGIRGYSVLTVARQSFGTALAGERYAGAFYRNGGRQPYLLKLAKKFKSDQEFDQFRDDWQKTYSDPAKAIILEPEIAYEKIGMSLADAQLLESRQFSIPEICRWFLISPDMVGDLSKATLNNMEQMALRFVKMTLTAWLVRWEQDLWRCVLTPKEKTQGYYFKHNVNGLLRGDFASRMSGFATALQNGHKNIDEVRELEDLNPLPNDAGQAYHIQLNMATVPGTGTPMVAEQGILNRIAGAAVSATGGNDNAN